MCAVCGTNPKHHPYPYFAFVIAAMKTKSAEEIAEEVAAKAKKVAEDEKAAAEAAAEKEKQERIARKKALNERFNASKSPWSQLDHRDRDSET